MPTAKKRYVAKKMPYFVHIGKSKQDFWGVWDTKKKVWLTDIIPKIKDAYIKLEYAKEAANKKNRGKK